MHNPESAMTKRILEFLRKKLQGPSCQGSSNKKEATPKVAQVSNTSNLVPQEPQLMVQNPNLSRGIPTLVKGSTTIVEEPELEVGAECPIGMVDAIIERVTGGDLSPHNVLPTL
jgi:hypothetical protein